MSEHTRADQGDAVLITRARESDDEAYGVLRERHGRAALRLARLLTRDRAEAEAAVDDAFAAVYEILRQGGGPSDAFRPFLLTTLRRRVAGHRDEEREAFDPDAPFVDPAMAGLEHRPMVRAYLSLPERWRAALWHTAVEGESPARVLPLFGIGADGVTALAHRSREGLRQAYLRLHLAEDPPEECRPVLDKIRLHLRGDLPGRRGARVRRHLQRCARCRTVAADLGHVNGRLPEVAALVLGAAASGYLVPRGLERPFRWARAVLAAWWWRSSPGRRKQALAAGALAVVLTAGLLAWPVGLFRPAGRHTGPAEAPVAMEPMPLERPEHPPSRATPREEPAEREGEQNRTRPFSSRQAPALLGPAEALRGAPAPAPPVLKAEVEPVGVLLPGRTGVVVLDVWNDGSAPSGEVAADVRLPRGVRPDGPADAGWSCLPAGRALRCTHAPLPPGGRASARLPVSVAPHAAAGAAPSVRLVGQSARARAATGVSTSGMPARFVADGRLRVVTAGNILLSCPAEEDGCGPARQRRGVRLDNDEWEMAPLDLDGSADTRTSSPALLELPGRVRWAGLYWSGVLEPEESGPPAARLRGPAGGYRTVEASRVDRADLSGQRVYQAFAEVTGQVRQGGAGRWWVADASAREGVGAYAGWSLVVVAEDPGAAPARTAVLDGALPVGVDAATRLRVPLSGLPRGGPAARIGLLAWEGDAGRAGDRVLLDGRPLSSPNAFTGSVPEHGRALAFGMDLVSYEARLADPSVLEVDSTADALVVGVITITAPSRR